jgi:hypothetical protein
MGVSCSTLVNASVPPRTGDARRWKVRSWPLGRSKTGLSSANDPKAAPDTSIWFHGSSGIVNDTDLPERE